MTVAEAYGRIAPVYDAAPNPLLALEERVLTPLLPGLGGTVIDIGAGTGRWLRGRGGIAVDLSWEMLRRAHGPRVQADAVALPLRDQCADVVLCTFTFGYAPSCFPELVRITRPGGKLIVTDVHPDAIARGWSRSFRVGAEVIQPDHQPYSLSSLSHPDLHRTHWLEPRLGEPERALFETRPHLYADACAHPAIFIGIWTKQ